MVQETWLRMRRVLACRACREVSAWLGACLAAVVCNAPPPPDPNNSTIPAAGVQRFHPVARTVSGAAAGEAAVASSAQGAASGSFPLAPMLLSSELPSLPRLLACDQSVDMEVLLQELPSQDAPKNGPSAAQQQAAATKPMSAAAAAAAFGSSKAADTLPIDDSPFCAKGAVSVPDEDDFGLSVGQLSGALTKLPRPGPDLQHGRRAHVRVHG